MKKYSLILIIIVITTIFLTTNDISYKTIAHADENEVQSNWSNAEKISDGTINAINPSLTSSPDGKTVLIAYSSYQNPYYSFSTQNGALNSWNKNNIVVSSTAKEIDTINATFDNEGYAHIVWKETHDFGSNLLGDQIAYARSNNKADLTEGFTAYSSFPKATTRKISNPIVVANNSLVHLIWAEADTNSFDSQIFHIMSQNNGVSWPSYAEKTKISHSFYEADSPSVTLDDQNNLHVVYQNKEDISTDRIFYKKGDVFYDNQASPPGYQVDWSEVVEVSHMLDFDEPFTFNVVSPKIAYDNGQLNVVATLRFKSDEGNYIYHFYCTSNCNSQENWKTNNAISGKLLEASDNPSNISASIAMVNGCSEVVYDGLDPLQSNEQIWNVNCRDWGISSTLTLNNIRALRPDIDMQDSAWWLYATYEKYLDENEREIYFIRTKPEARIFLPIIVRN